jgi:MoxR-like ATPase
LSNEFVKSYLDEEQESSQNSILAAKASAAFNGKFSPDIEDGKNGCSRRILQMNIRNYKANY